MSYNYTILIRLFMFFFSEKDSDCNPSSSILRHGWWSKSQINCYRVPQRPFIVPLDLQRQERMSKQNKSKFFMKDILNCLLSQTKIWTKFETYTFFYIRLYPLFLLCRWSDTEKFLSRTKIDLKKSSYIISGSQ